MPLFTTTYTTKVFQGNTYTLLERDVIAPLEYLKLFWDDGVTKNLVEQTNIYSIQVSGKCIKCQRDGTVFRLENVNVNNLFA